MCLEMLCKYGRVRPTARATFQGHPTTVSSQMQRKHFLGYPETSLEIRPL